MKINRVRNALCWMIYYALIQHLPHSRYVGIFGNVRRFYICNIMCIAEYHADSMFENNIYLSGIGKVKIGKDCQINEYVFIQGAHIGNNVMIAPHASLLCNVKETRNTQIPMNKQGWVEKNKRVVIHDDVWIGRNAIILPGVIIEKGSIVAAGAVVTKSFPAYSILAGVPAKVVKYRNGAI